MSYEMFRTVGREIGGLLIILGLSMILPLAVSVIYQEWYSAVGFLLSGLVISGIGYVAHQVFLKNSADPEKMHAMIIAASGWLTVALFGSIPFFLIAHITPPEVIQSFVPQGETYTSSLINFKNPLHAFFESMSGFTTTGLTMSVHEPSVGKGVLFYRSTAQWIGGAGFIVMTIATIQGKPGRSLLTLYNTEASGEKLKPTVIGTARAIWKLYLGLTLFQIIALLVGTTIILPDYPFSDALFDSINHALTGMATGGFSPLDNSIATYGSYALEMLHLLPMIMGSLAFPFYFRIIYKQEFNQLWRDIQTITLLPYYIIGGLILTFFLVQSGITQHPFREAIFQFVSGLSQTGWQTSNISQWDTVSVVFLVCFAMFIGGSVGSTVGGIKIRRALLIQKGLRWQVAKIFFPRKMIKTAKFDYETLLPKEMNTELAQASTFAFIYLLLVLGGTLVTAYSMEPGFALSDAFFESASAQGTVGLTRGITRPDMSPVVESTFILQMWAGRLEIIPIVVLVRALLFGTNPKII